MKACLVEAEVCTTTGREKEREGWATMRVMSHLTSKKRNTDDCLRFIDLHREREAMCLALAPKMPSKTIEHSSQNERRQPERRRRRRRRRLQDGRQ
mmetsp:Transcript_33358/g.71477  ORF Transcript_33358/g.71477 Transcript_33358/m.71477 type:complete len:96 (-) Transcript_33358:2-289(-)